MLQPAPQAGRVRKTIIRIALERQKPGSGSSIEFLRARTASVDWPDIREALGGVPVAVVGAVATRHYMPERVTQDISFVIAVEDAPAARNRLKQAGWEYRGELSIGGSTWISPAGISIDLLEGRESWWKEAIAGAAGNADMQGLPVLPLPYLVLMKFRSGRAQDIADVARMLGQAAEEALENTRVLFQTEEPSGLEDLESLIFLGRLELQGPT